MILIPLLFYLFRRMAIVIGLVAIVSFVGLIITTVTPESP